MALLIGAVIAWIAIAAVLAVVVGRGIRVADEQAEAEICASDVEGWLADQGGHGPAGTVARPTTDPEEDGRP